MYHSACTTSRPGKTCVRTNMKQVYTSHVSKYTYKNAMSRSVCSPGRKETIMAVLFPVLRGNLCCIALHNFQNSSHLAAPHNWQNMSRTNLKLTSMSQMSEYECYRNLISLCTCDAARTENNYCHIPLLPYYGSFCCIALHNFGNCSTVSMLSTNWKWIQNCVPLTFNHLPSKIRRKYHRDEFFLRYNTSNEPTVASNNILLHTATQQLRMPILDGLFKRSWDGGFDRSSTIPRTYDHSLQCLPMTRCQKQQKQQTQV